MLKGIKTRGRRAREDFNTLNFKNRFETGRLLCSNASSLTSTCIFEMNFIMVRHISVYHSLNLKISSSFKVPDAPTILLQASSGALGPKLLEENG